MNISCDATTTTYTIKKTMMLMMTRATVVYFSLSFSYFLFSFVSSSRFFSLFFSIFMHVREISFNRTSTTKEERSNININKKNNKNGFWLRSKKNYARKEKQKTTILDIKRLSNLRERKKINQKK